MAKALVVYLMYASTQVLLVKGGMLGSQTVPGRGSEPLVK